MDHKTLAIRMFWCRRHILCRAYVPTPFLPLPLLPAMLSSLLRALLICFLSLPTQKCVAFPHMLIPLLLTRGRCAPDHTCSVSTFCLSPTHCACGSSGGLHTPLSACPIFFLAALLGNFTHPSPPIPTMSITSIQKQLLGGPDDRSGRASQ